MADRSKRRYNSCMQLKESLEKIMKGEVACDEATLDTHSRDASLFRVVPQAVVFPKDTQDIKRLVDFARAEKEKGTDISLTARAAGTDMSGGSLNESIIVDTTRHMNRIVNISDTNATVEPGLMCRDFEQELAKHGVVLPSYPASRAICALGGMIANNSSGEKSLNHGSAKDYTESVRAVLADGNEYEFGPLTQAELDTKLALKNFEGTLYREVSALIEKNRDLIASAKPNVSKNSTGYLIWEVWKNNIFNMAKLFVGSQGTLGIVTSARVHLMKPKPYSSLLVIFLSDFSQLGGLVGRVLAEKPESFESYDDHTFKLAVRFFPDIVRSMKTGIIALGLRFIPEFFMTLSGGIPKLILLVEFTGDTREEAQKKARDAKTHLADLRLSMRVTHSAKDAQKYWTVRHESFNLLRHHVKNGRTAPFIDDIVVRPEVLPEFLPRLSAIMAGYDITYTIAGHVGEGNFHIIPIMDFKHPDAQKIFEELSKKVFDLVFEFHGSMSGEHNDGIVRTPYLKQMYGEKVYSLFENIKRIFDPLNIFNPRKKIGGTQEYALAHLDDGK